MTPLQKTVGLCLALVMAVVGMFVYSVTREHVPSLDELRGQGVFLLPEPIVLSGFQLETHRGDVFLPEHLAGDWSFVFFGFTRCPDVCPTTLSVMAQAERRLAATGASFKGVLVSVDPERDDRESLSTYVRAFSERFLGVRGELTELAKFARQVHVVFAKVPDNRIVSGTGSAEGGFTVDHSGNIVVIDPRGHYHGFIKMPHKVDTLLAVFRYLRSTW